MSQDPMGAKEWSLFDLEVPPAGRIEYPLHVRVWEPRKAGVLTMDVHQGMEIGIVLRGKMERHYEDLTFVANGGDVHLCSAWEPHGWRVVAPNTSQVVLIFLAEVIDDATLREVPWLSLFTVPPRERPRTTGERMRREILAIGRSLRREALQRQHGWLSAVGLLLHYLLLTLNRYWQPPKTPSSQARVLASSFTRVMPAVQLVHADPARDVGQREAAKACGLHRSQFACVFRQTMGVTFGQFRRRARLARVAYLLLTTDLPTDAIAEETGFVDGSHLHRTFVQNYRCTPGQYRATHRG